MTRRPGAAPAGGRAGAFRVIQEALSNVGRHSGASRAEVRLGADPGLFSVSVADDGTASSWRPRWTAGSAASGCSACSERRWSAA